MEPEQIFNVLGAIALGGILFALLAPLFVAFRHCRNKRLAQKAAHSSS